MPVRLSNLEADSFRNQLSILRGDDFRLRDLVWMWNLALDGSSSNEGKYVGLRFLQVHLARRNVAKAPVSRCSCGSWVTKLPLKAYLHSLGVLHKSADGFTPTAATPRKSLQVADLVVARGRRGQLFE